MGHSSPPFNYEVTLDVFGDWPALEISEIDYSNTFQAKENLLQFLAIEEAYDIVIANYEEFEGCVLAFPLENLLYAGRDWHTFIETLRLFNRRFMNVLTACRGYFDHVDGCLKNVFSDSSSQVEQYARSRSQHYDSSSSYRLMENVRNISQHSTSPIKKLTAPTERVDEEDRVLIRFRANPLLSKESIIKKCKSVVKEDLLNRPEWIPLIPELRSYIQSISQINGEVRNAVADSFRLSAQMIRDLKERFRTSFPEVTDDEAKHLAAYKFRPDHRGFRADVEHFALFEDFIQHRENLVTQNRVLRNLAEQFVSGRFERR